MSNDMTMFTGKTQLPAYIQEIKEDATTKALAGRSGFGRRISIRGNVFRMIVDGEEIATSDDRALNVVVVAASDTVARTYYAENYVEGEVTAPTCWSADGITPDASIKEKQSDTCAKCPQNVVGSGQGDSRACRFSQRLAVVLESDIESSVYQISLPAQSIFGKGEGGKLPMQAYAKFLKGHGCPVTAVVTEMRFDTQSATPKLVFRATRPLQEAEYRTCVKQGATEDAKRAVEFTVAQFDGVAEKPAKAPLLAATPQETVKEIQRQEEAIVAEKKEVKKGFQPIKRVKGNGENGGVDVQATTTPEPVRMSKPKVEETPKKDLKSIVQQWAAETDD